MGQEKVKLPTSPSGWAIRLTQVVKIFHEVHSLDRFPIKVADIARDYSAQVFPQSPITFIEGQPLSNKFEGALIPKQDGSGEWGIIYNSSISSQGRINFTLGHELGHYLLHRQLSGEPILCEKSAMWEWDSAYGRMEAEANEFASFLLMPRDDFDLQTSGLRDPSVQFFNALRLRYDVSLTAVILKWLSFTSRRAMIVVSRDGFIDWSWSSKSLLKSGVYFKARQVTVPLPASSLAALQDTSADALMGKTLGEGVWAKDEPVMESVIHSEYHGMAISLLVYPDEPPPFRPWARDHDEEPVEDTFSRMRL